MGAHDVLVHLSALGVRLTREGEVIRAAPRSALTDEARALIRAHKAELMRALEQEGTGSAEPEPAPLGEQVSDHWLIIEPPTKTERWFTPPVTRSELERRYPGAALVPLPDTGPAPVGQRKLAPGELDELATLIPLVAEHYGCPPEELAEMRTVAATDPSGALVSFRAMARELVAWTVQSARQNAS